jgi:beta-1,4-mannosyl-glycoprotein beta-1,4-N-acetylglucosaminyltransferase
MNIPNYVVEHAKDLKYLLPGDGNCIREDFKDAP